MSEQFSAVNPELWSKFPLKSSWFNLFSSGAVEVRPQESGPSLLQGRTHTWTDHMHMSFQQRASCRLTVFSSLSPLFHFLALLFSVSHSSHSGWRVYSTSKLLFRRRRFLMKALQRSETNLIIRNHRHSCDSPCVCDTFVMSCQKEIVSNKHFVFLNSFLQDHMSHTIFLCGQFSTFRVKLQTQLCEDGRIQ